MWQENYERSAAEVRELSGNTAHSAVMDALRAKYEELKDDLVTTTHHESLAGQARLVRELLNDFSPEDAGKTPPIY